jgi:hypothetical protein
MVSTQDEPTPVTPQLMGLTLVQVATAYWGGLQKDPNLSAEIHVNEDAWRMVFQESLRAHFCLASIRFCEYFENDEELTNLYGFRCIEFLRHYTMEDEQAAWDAVPLYGDRSDWPIFSTVVQETFSDSDSINYAINAYISGKLTEQDRSTVEIFRRFSGKDKDGGLLDFSFLLDARVGKLLNLEPRSFPMFQLSLTNTGASIAAWKVFQTLKPVFSEQETKMHSKPSIGIIGKQEEPSVASVPKPAGVVNEVARPVKLLKTRDSTVQSRGGIKHKFLLSCIWSGALLIFNIATLRPDPERDLLTAVSNGVGALTTPLELLLSVAAIGVIILYGRKSIGER